jgi:hypothetical protein
MTNDSSGAEVGPEAGYYSKDFPDFVSDLLKDWHVPGISIAVADGDLLIHKVSPEFFASPRLQKLYETLVSWSQRLDEY